MKALIKNLKYKSVKEIGEVLGRLLWKTTSLGEFDLVTAVSLHQKRQAKRGFNQAEIIGKTLAQQAKKPYQNLLIRTKNTLNQAVVRRICTGGPHLGSVV